MATHGRRRTVVPPVSRKTTARGKRAFDIYDMFARIERAIAPFKKAAMFELAEHGHRSLFAQLVACVLSIRTLDEVSLPAALRLFEVASTPEKLAGMSVE